MVSFVELTQRGAAPGFEAIKVLPHAIVAISGTIKATVHMTNGEKIDVTDTASDVARKLGEALGKFENDIEQIRRILKML